MVTAANLITAGILSYRAYKWYRKIKKNKASYGGKSKRKRNKLIYGKMTNYGVQT